jgi:hypothetical protein
MTARLHAALAAAGKGLPVSPLRGQKRPRTELAAWARHTTLDADRTRRWWRRHPTENVAITTGPTGLDSPTLGAWRRLNGITDEQCARTVRWMIANEMVTELQRIGCVDELASITRFVSAGAAPCAIARRLRQLANRLHSPGDDEPAGPPYPGGQQAVAEQLAAAVLARVEEVV